MRLIATYNPDTDLMAARRFIGILQFNRRITDGHRYDEQELPGGALLPN